MMKKLIRPLFVIAIVLVMIPGSSAIAQHHRGSREKPWDKFDWNCASTSAFPRQQLSRLVQIALKRQGTTAAPWADRAFAFDLNGDHKPEYFVPLDCGATGNCHWGIFALRPTRLLGLIGGEYIFVHKRAGRWPRIIAYGHLSVAEGSLRTYRFNKRSYVSVGEGYPVGPGFLEIQNVPGHKMPKFLESARVACKNLGG
jgi:hypothetical protein